jgi:hypothetical protein
VRALRRARLRHAWICVLWLAASAAPAGAQPVQSHSMVHICCTPDADQAAVIGAAKASGASIVRLDVELHGIVTPSPYGYLHDFSRLDRAIALARHARIRILGVLVGTPAGMTACPPGTLPVDSWKCSPSDPEAYARAAISVMEHAGSGVLAWEFWNEPDLSYMYLGTPEQYGRTLGAIHRRAAGRFRLTNGGLATPATGEFLRRAIHAGARFDIGNVHLRGSRLRARARAASRFFGRRALWITEHGYPSQPDPQAQLRYLSRSIPALLAGGADQIFVTLPDSTEFGPDSPFASEGILGKPAWNLIVRLNRRARDLLIVRHDRGQLPPGRADVWRGLRSA